MQYVTTGYLQRFCVQEGMYKYYIVFPDFFLKILSVKSNKKVDIVFSNSTEKNFKFFHFFLPKKLNLFSFNVSEKS